MPEASSAMPGIAVPTNLRWALVLQVSRMRDGIRRVTHVTEIVGMEGDVVTTQDLFTFEYQERTETGP
jgi:pilus assembly protein CpaF